MKSRWVRVILVGAMGFALPLSAAAAGVAEQMVANEVAMQASTMNKALLPEPGLSIKIAVYNLELDNIPEGMGRIITNALLTEIRKLEGVSAIGMAEIYEMLEHEKTKQIMGCEEDTSCLAEIAGALGVDELVTGSLSEAADGRGITLRRISQRRAGVISAIDQRLEIGNGEEFLLAIGPGVAAMYPDRPNRPGTTRGVPEEMVLRLNPPPIPSWVTYSVMGATAAAGILSGLSYYLGDNARNNAMNDADQAIDNFGSNPDNIPSADTFIDYDNQVQQWNGVYQASGIAAASLAVTAAVMSFFTDWMGYGDEEVGEVEP